SRQPRRVRRLATTHRSIPSSCATPASAIALRLPFTPCSRHAAGSILILVVTSHPCLRVRLLVGLVPPFRGKIDIVIGTVPHIDATLEAGICVENLLRWILAEDADPDDVAVEQPLVPVIPIAAGARSTSHPA